jgi:hypothetical protein
MQHSGLQNVSSKPDETRENFLLHLRYSFRHPRLTVRDHAAIEHQASRKCRKMLIPNEGAHILIAFAAFGGPRHLYRSRLSSSSLIYHHRFISAFHRRSTDSPLHKNPRYARRTLGTADERERGDDRLVARSSTGGQGEATGAGATGWRRSRNGIVRAGQKV